MSYVAGDRSPHFSDSLWLSHKGGPAPGMPVFRKGRYVTASKAELSRWLGRESGVDAPVHIASDPGDLTRDLKRGLTYVLDASSRKKKAR
jgi:hypothetical protein